MNDQVISYNQTKGATLSLHTWVTMRVNCVDLISSSDFAAGPDGSWFKTLKVLQTLLKLFRKLELSRQKYTHLNKSLPFGSLEHLHPIKVTILIR